jgi:hypothetical protein
MKIVVSSLTEINITLVLTFAEKLSEMMWQKYIRHRSSAEVWLPVQDIKLWP